MTSLETQGTTAQLGKHLIHQAALHSHTCTVCMCIDTAVYLMLMHVDACWCDSSHALITHISD